MIEQFGEFIPALTALALAGLALFISHWWFLGRHSEYGAESRLPGQLTLALLGLVAVLAVLLTLPLSDAARSQVLSLLGVVLTGVIGLSSTTFVSNAMAGMMLRVVGQFRPGDFVRVGDHLGRVTERGLLHVEIQTEDSDLTTLPNLFLITNPVTVVHRDGTIVSATVSLGYEVHRHHIEDALCRAAESCGLEKPFVQITELGDYSVIYRVAGFLGEVKHLLTARSNLRKAMVDALHAADIEIVSPSFMNQRPQPEGSRMIPAPERPRRMDTESAPESLIFDKADQAEQLEALRGQLSAVGEALAQCEDKEGPEHARLVSERERLNAEIEALGEAARKDKAPPAADGGKA